MITPLEKEKKSLSPGVVFVSLLIKLLFLFRWGGGVVCLRWEGPSLAKVWSFIMLMTGIFWTALD